MDEKAAQRVERYRKQAEEIRSAAEGMTHSESRTALLRLAATYDRLAARIEQEQNSRNGQ